MSFNINNHHDKILIPEVGGQIKWYLIGVNQSKTHIHNLSIIYSMVNYSIFIKILTLLKKIYRQVPNQSL